jgi:phage gp36-like protein
MPLFAGNLLRDPVDFASVATERGLVQSTNDPDAPSVPLDANSFDDLPNDDGPVGEEVSRSTRAQAIALLNEIIREAESTVDSYARTRGYRTPLLLVDNATPDPTARKMAAKIAHIDLLLRRSMISSDYASLELDRIQRDLRDIAAGRISLLVPMNPDATEVSQQTVYAITSEERVFSREKLRGY